MLVEYTRRARGLPGSKDVLPILDQLIPETHGTMIFQEQLQKIYQYCTDCTGTEAEEFRTNTAKKKKEKVDKAYPKFMERAGAKLGEQEAQALWDFMVSWSRYGFNCIEGTQEILTSTGLKPIASLSALDRVASLVGKTIEYLPPVKIWCSGEKEVLEVILEDGTTIRGTENHRFLYGKQWVTLKDLILKGEVETR
jgi:hypothetical protein